jgi:hypothetical protein
MALRLEDLYGWECIKTEAVSRVQKGWYIQRAIPRRERRMMGGVNHSSGEGWEEGEAEGMRNSISEELKRCTRAELIFFSCAKYAPAGSERRRNARH